MTVFFQNILVIIGQKNNVFLTPYSLKLNKFLLINYLLATDYLRKIQAVEISVFWHMAWHGSEFM